MHGRQVLVILQVSCNLSETLAGSSSELSLFSIPESGGRSVNENKALTSKKNRFTPYGKFETCKICKQKVHQMGSHYCQCKLSFPRFGTRLIRNYLIL